MNYYLRPLSTVDKDGIWDQNGKTKTILSESLDLNVP